MCRGNAAPDREQHAVPHDEGKSELHPAYPRACAGQHVDPTRGSEDRDRSTDGDGGGDGVVVMVMVMVVVVTMAV